MGPEVPVRLGPETLGENRDSWFNEGMKRRSLLLSLLFALPVRAAVLTEVNFSPAAATGGAAAASVSLSAPAFSLTTGLSPAISLSAPALTSLAAPEDGPKITPSPYAPPQMHGDAPVPGHVSVPVDAQNRLFELFPSLDARYPIPDSSPAHAVRLRLRAQLLAAARDLAEPDSHILETVAREADRALAKIQKRLDAGEIDPSRTIRLSEDAPPVADDSHARVGVYPVAADPFQWGHLLIALRAVGDLGVDKVVFVLAGDDPRKPTMTPVVTRHPMGREVLAAFAPFFDYSPIAVGTTLDGETNIFRILALNPDRRVDAWYMVGDDHYKLVDKKGNPDTLPKLEANLQKPMGHSPTLHALKVAFIKREHPAEEVPTDLEVRFLDHVGFDASSTQVRSGQHTLMPHAAYDFARREGLYGIAPADDADEPKSGD